MNLTVVVDPDAPTDGAMVRDDDGDYLLLNPAQSHESLVDVVLRLGGPNMRADTARELVRRHVPDAPRLSSLGEFRDDAEAARPPVEVHSRRTLAVSLVLSSVMILPVLGYAAQRQATFATALLAGQELESLLADFEIRCLGKVEYDTAMRCVADSLSARVTVTQQGVAGGTVMLIECANDASMVVKAASAEAAEHAVRYGYGRMLVGDSPTAVGRYVVTSTNPDRQVKLEARAKTVVATHTVQREMHLDSPREAPRSEVQDERTEVPVSRGGPRPFLDG